MAKFYVQSGSFRGIVDSYDEESAAVWAIHRVMDHSPTKMLSNKQTKSPCPPSDSKTPESTTPFDPLIDPVFDGTSAIENELREQADVGLFRLGDSIGISERGFNRKDRTKIPTKEAFLKWIQLMHAINALHDQMDQAFSDW
ncbi:MAG: hypothetical protein ACK52S_22765 [Pirellula sp.]